MISFPRTLKRKVHIIFHAVCLFLGALSILFSIQHFTNSPSNELDSKLSNDLPLPKNQAFAATEVNGVIPSSTPSPILENAPFKPSRPLDPALETTLPKPSIIAETSAPMKDSSLEDGNSTLLEKAPVYIKAIMTQDDKSFPRLDCPAPTGSRYDYLKHNSIDSNGSRKYFFALDLHQCAELLPRLIGSIVETMRFLGPKNCALSIIEGHSDDGTYEILKLLRADIENMGVKYFFNRSEIDQTVSDRIVALAELRNLVLEPLVDHPDQYSTNATVLFLNDVSICMEDILELIHQRIYQGADMVCPFDWTFPAGLENDPTFYDVWITRGMTGDSFFNIPIEAANWDRAWDLLWNDDKARKRYFEHKPFQVFSCWSGAAVFTAKPLLNRQIRFRSYVHGECVQGEPQLFCKDMWHIGYGRIAMLPAVNIEYGDEGAKKIKALKGYTSQWVNKDGQESPFEHIEWEAEPPAQIKCYEGPWDHQTWVDWDEHLSDVAADPAAQEIVVNTINGIQKHPD